MISFVRVSQKSHLFLWCQPGIKRIGRIKMCEKNDFLENFKPEGSPEKYEKCLYCGNNDLSNTLQIYGICLGCWKDFEGKIPKELRIPLGRIWLYRSFNKLDG